MKGKLLVSDKQMIDEVPNDELSIKRWLDFLSLIIIFFIGAGGGIEDSKELTLPLINLKFENEMFLYSSIVGVWLFLIWRWNLTNNYNFDKSFNKFLKSDTLMPYFFGEIIAEVIGKGWKGTPTKKISWIFDSGVRSTCYLKGDEKSNDNYGSLKKIKGVMDKNARHGISFHFDNKIENRNLREDAYQNFWFELDIHESKEGLKWFNQVKTFYKSKRPDYIKDNLTYYLVLISAASIMIKIVVTVFFWALESV